MTNSGGNAGLFFWDGSSDLVQDVDLVNLGTPSSTNDIGDKTGLSVDGPDAGTVASTYLPDAFTMPQQAGDPGPGLPTKRLSVEAPNEVTGGGNGINNDDLTAGNILLTRDAPRFSAPAPGTCSGAVPVFLQSFPFT